MAALTHTYAHCYSANWLWKIKVFEAITYACQLLIAACVSP